MRKETIKSILYGIVCKRDLAWSLFCGANIGLRWSFAQIQFATYWYFIVSLAVGFGIQIALYQYIKNLVHSGQGMGKVVSISGTTSTGRYDFLLRSLFSKFVAYPWSGRTRYICRSIPS